MTTDRDRVAAPEWATAVRKDRRVDTGLTGGWVATPSPIARGAAFTDFTDRHIAVPEGDSDIATGVRFHELLHVRHSPTTVPTELMIQLGIPVQTMRVAEETRMNLLAVGTPSTGVFGRDTKGFAVASTKDGVNKERENLRRVVKGIKDGTEAAQADFAVEHDDFRSAVYQMFATWGLDCFRDVKRRLRRKPEWKDAVGGIAKYLKEHFDPDDRWAAKRLFASTQPIEYRWVDRRTERSVILPEGFAVSTVGIANLIERIIEDGGVAGKTIKKEGDEETATERGDDPDKGVPRQKSNAEWAGLRIGITSLTDTTATFIGRRKRPAITGKFPSRPDRLLTDPERRIFREVVRGNGGVVVFDCSGSMGVDYQVVRDAVAQFAGATVLAYTHVGANVANAWVLAQNGRMISADDMNDLPLNNGNGVDGQALRWALRQRRSPKDFILWVSDLGVTGVNDWTDDDLLLDCANLCRKHNIAQAHNTDQALEMLATIKRTGTVGRRNWSTRMEQIVQRIENGEPVPIVGVDYSR